MDNKNISTVYPDKSETVTRIFFEQVNRPYMYVFITSHPMRLSVFVLQSIFNAAVPAPSEPISLGSSFHVCMSGISGLNGLYELDEDMKSNDAPVYTRVDDGIIDSSTDFRLFRHQGYWNFGDFSAWPPNIHFRCDPTVSKYHETLCQVDLETPPMQGYSSRIQDETLQAPVLQVDPCEKQDIKQEL
jgi:hypothetical protein